MSPKEYYDPLVKLHDATQDRVCDWCHGTGRCDDEHCDDCCSKCDGLGNVVGINSATLEITARMFGLRIPDQKESAVRDMMLHLSALSTYNKSVKA